MFLSLLIEKLGCYQTTLTEPSRLHLQHFEKKNCHKEYKHQRIRDVQHPKDLLEEKWEELRHYEIDSCINQLRHRLYKVIEVAGKHIEYFF